MHAWGEREGGRGGGRDGRRARGREGEREEFFQEEHILAVAVQLYQSGDNETASISIVRKEFDCDKSQPTLELYKDRDIGRGAYIWNGCAKYGHFTCACCQMYSSGSDAQK